MIERLTENLIREEFKCQCGCGQDTIDFMLVTVLQEIVDHFQLMRPDMDVRIRINSGNRCPEHNAKVGGSSNSQHLYGKAADFALYDKLTGQHIFADDVADYIDDAYPDTFGLGRYIGRTHLDVRKNKSRWVAK